MSKRIKLNREELSKVQTRLKKRGYTLDDIQKKIDADFRNFLYKNHSMSKETFDKLEEIYPDKLNGKEIEYIDGKGERNQINISQDKETAELIGIMLGDGYIQHTSKNRGDRIISSNRLVITLHEDEKNIISKTKDLMSDITNIKPNMYSLKDQKTIQIAKHSKEVVEEFINLGPRPGDKVQHQVRVPKWIKNQRELMRACLRGLIDTDGTIYTQSTDNRTVVQFKNHSQPLLDDFNYMCTRLGVSTSSGAKRTTQIANQGEVKKFIHKIEPIKSAEFSF